MDNVNQKIIDTQRVINYMAKFNIVSRPKSEHVDWDAFKRQDMKRYDPMVEAAKPLLVLYTVAIIIGLILGIICWIFDIRI